MTAWRKPIDEALFESGEALEECTLTEEELDEEISAVLGIATGRAFTAWAKSYVIFPACYDSSEWAETVPRNPCDVAAGHVGGKQGGGVGC